MGCVRRIEETFPGVLWRQWISNGQTDAKDADLITFASVYPLPIR